ncbi:MAG: Pr6Pr family membrane protein [Propionibacteriaceae bacterium]|jgi:hypothetical protein|nr:Pr6Pr family membrane protein [Propionibacteriaceae bacterium]
MEKPLGTGAVTVCIALTFLVFHFVLRPSMFSMGEYSTSVANALAHYAVPLMAIADWLAFDPKGQMKKLDPVKWLLIPAAYLAFALVRAQFGIYAGSDSRYPYFFIDIDQYGGPQVVVNCLAIAAAYTLLGYAVYALDWTMSVLARNLRSKDRLAG